MEKLKATYRNCAAVFAALFSVGFLLVGCASTAGLSSQGQIASPATLTAEKTFAKDGSQHVGNWPVADWWRALGDFQLDALIQEALQASPDLAAAEAHMRQATAATMASDASRAPKITAQASVQGIRIPGKVLSSTTDHEYFTPKILGLNGSYSADLWGGQRATWEAALGRQHAAEIDAKAAQVLVSVDVARSYAQLGYAYAAYDLVQKDAERAQHLLTLTMQRVAAGIDSIGQQRQMEAQVAAIRQRLAQAAHSIESEKIALAVLVGKGPDRAAEITRPAVLQPLVLALPENLPADLLGRRPDIIATRWRVEAAQHDIAASKASFYPSFNLTAAIGLISFHTDDLISLRSRYYAVAPAISLPIFDGGRLRANLAGSNAEYDIAVAQYNKTLVGALNEVALQIQSAQALTEQESAQQQSVGAAHEAWDMAMQRYRRGIGSYIEALTLEQSVLAAETTLANIHTQQIDTAIQLVHALGGGYTSASQGGAPPSAPQTDKASS